MKIKPELWFDVGYKRYTTRALNKIGEDGCGLMQDIKDIQRKRKIKNEDMVVV